MNYNYPTTICRSIFAQMYKFLAEKFIFTIFAYELFKVKMKNYLLPVLIPEISDTHDEDPGASRCSGSGRDQRHVVFQIVR